MCVCCIKLYLKINENTENRHQLPHKIVKSGYLLAVVQHLYWTSIAEILSLYD